MNLQDVCKNMLDNADMLMDLKHYPDITLHFSVFGAVKGKFWEVIFQCPNTIEYHAEIDDEMTEDDCYMVLEANVTQRRKGSFPQSIKDKLHNLDENSWVWDIHIESDDIILDLVTTEFSWQLHEIAGEEYFKRYPII